MCQAFIHKGYIPANKPIFNGRIDWSIHALTVLMLVSVVFAVSSEGRVRVLVRRFGFSLNESMLFSMRERSGEFLMERILIFLGDHTTEDEGLCLFFSFNSIEDMSLSKCVSFNVRTT